MVIEQEVSKVEGQTSLDSRVWRAQTENHRAANDGDADRAGGLMDDQAGESVAKVPHAWRYPIDW